MNALTTSNYEAKLLDEKAWCAGVIAHLADHATMDSESNYTVTMARRKLTVIERALRQLAAGTYDQCDRCSEKIEAERLELLLNDDNHLCAHCATASRLPNKRLPARRPTYYGQMAGAYA